MERSNSSDYACYMPARKKKPGRGGRREGAGRKPFLEDPVAFTLDIETPEMDALRALAEEREASVASLVRSAITAFLRRRKRI